MSDKNNDMVVEGESNAHVNVFEISTNPAPIIRLKDGNLGGDFVFLPNDEIPQQWLTMQEIEKSHFLCIPTEIIDPSNFWVQVEKTKHELVDLMIALRDFYCNISEMFAALPQNLCENLMVVVLRNNWYFRCRILGLTQTHVKLHFVDYGKTAYAPIDKVYHLYKQFGILKAQAIHCRLFNLKAPTDNVLYPRTARIATNQMMKDCLLVAFIDKIQEATRTIELSLYPLTQNSTPISDWLVRHGHAEFICNQSRKL